MTRARLPSGLRVAVALAAAVVAVAAGGRPAVGAAVAPRSAAASVAAALPPPLVPVGVADAAGVALPSPTGRSFKRWVRRNVKSIKKDLKKVGTEISRPFREAGRGIRKAFDAATEAVAKVVRDAGREVRRAAEDAANAVREAGRDVRKFIKRRTEEVQAVVDSIRKLFDRGEEESEEADEAAKEAEKKRQEAEDAKTAAEKAAADAAAAAAQKTSEDAAAASLQSMKAGKDQYRTLSEDAVEESSFKADSLRSYMDRLSKPLSRSQRKNLKTAQEEALEVLGNAQNVAENYTVVVGKAKNGTSKIQDSAIRTPDSKPLATTALAAQALLESMVTVELDLASVMTDLKTEVDRAKELLA